MLCLIALFHSDELKVEVNAKAEQLEADRVEKMRLEDAIAELEKESADLDIEMVSEEIVLRLFSLANSRDICFR